MPVPHLNTTRATAIAALAATAVALGACGSSSNSSNSSPQPAQGQQRGPFASLSADARACLAKQGITPPSGGRPANGQRPPNGQAPSGGQRPANGARFQKLRAAMQKCGVKLPNRAPGGAPPSGAAGGTGTTQSQ